MNWKMALGGVAVTVPLIVILAMGFGHDPHAVPSVLEGHPAPAFSLQSLEGKTFSLAALAGRPAVINFWATWCYPCQAEHELLQDAAQFYGDRVQFLGVIYQDGADPVRKYLQSRKNRYPQLIDPQSALAIDFGVAGVPESFIINQKGEIVHKQAGVLTGDILRQYLGALLGAEKS